MADSIRSNLLAGKAYALFVDELDRHLTQARQKLLDEGKVNKETCQSVRSSFHTIKGGAGFFGFNDVAQAASQVENFLTLPLSQINAQLADIKEKILHMEKLAQALPQPGSSEKINTGGSK